MNQTTIRRTISQFFITSAIALMLTTQAEADQAFSNKLLLTGGVSQVEGAAGSGLTPWAVIGGNVRYAFVKTGDFDLNSIGITAGFYNRFELSVAEQKFDVSNLRGKVSAGLGASVIGRDTLVQR